MLFHPCSLADLFSLFDYSSLSPLKLNRPQELLLLIALLMLHFVKVQQLQMPIAVESVDQQQKRTERETQE